MTEQSEKKCQMVRAVCTSSFAIILAVLLVLSAFAGSGTGPFNSNTGDISRNHEIPITPASFTFSIWGVIYFLLVLIAIYGIVLLFRRVGLERSWTLGNAVSNTFLVVASLNFVLNMSWLFVWDREQMIASAVLLVLVALSNIAALAFAAHSASKACPRLWLESSFDFWASLCVLNAYAVYVMWTVIAMLLNIAIAIDEQTKKLDANEYAKIRYDVSVAILCILLAGMFFYFILEQTILKKVANPIFTHYLVYVWAMFGVIQKDNEKEAAIFDLCIANISIAALLLVLRIIFLVVRNRNNKLYAPFSL